MLSRPHVCHPGLPLPEEAPSLKTGKTARHSLQRLDLAFMSHTNLRDQVGDSPGFDPGRPGSRLPVATRRQFRLRPAPRSTSHTTAVSAAASRRAYGEDVTLSNAATRGEGSLADSDPRSERSSPSAAHRPPQANPTDQIVLARRTLTISRPVVIMGIRTVLSNSRRPLSGCRDRMRSRGRRAPCGSCRSSWPV